MNGLQTLAKNDMQLGVGSNEHTPEFEGKARDVVACSLVFGSG